MTDWREAVDSWIDARADELRSIRRHLHSHPEPSREEYQTIRFLASRLAEEGVPHALIPSRRGILAGALETDGRPLVAFRADVDALRIADAKEVEYRSLNEGIMHACGHDAHATMALGAALALWRCRENLPAAAAWRALFQPAEEVGEGALEMVAAGAMEGVRAILALHVDPERPTGRVGCRVGPLTAFCHELHVTIQGAGGHAARPHQVCDPIIAASQFVSTVYQLVPRSIDARDPAVVTFGSIQGGASANVVPEQVVLMGTIRTLSRASSQRIAERVQQIAEGIAAATETTFVVDLVNSTDGVVNDPGVTESCLRAAGEVVGPENLDEIPLPSMGGEDFSGYLTQAPGCLLRLGVAEEGKPQHLLHSPYFDLDERALTLGAKILAHGAILTASTLAGGRP
jgi:amidohydrolase